MLKSLRKSDVLFAGFFLAAVCGVLALGTQTPRPGSDARHKPLSLASTALEMPAARSSRTEPAADTRIEEFVDYTFVFPAPNFDQHSSQAGERRIVGR